MHYSINNPTHYQVLARKWRPQTFQEMVGQEHIQRMLMNALDSQRLHHAYLFTGTRGVGKTTLARILAKCLNCEAGVTSAPCNTCDTCLAINAGKFLDLIEVDAASRTKVEDTRELLENVQYAPTQGRYKIYLIDEVHMLSSHSFNALLKTLEEPPAHVKFLLATTEPKRLPITILSRCLQFHLHHVPVEKIAHHLAHICTTENITHEIPALTLLAKAADGSMRDALSLLDQTIAYCSSNITLIETQTMLGTLDQDVVFRLLDALAKQNGAELLKEITELAQHGPDFDQVLEDLLSTLHGISVAQIVPDINTSERIQQFANTFSAEDIQLYYQMGLLSRRDLPLAPSPHQGFEMAMLRMLAFHPARPKKSQPKEPVQQQTIEAKKTIATKKPVEAESHNLTGSYLKNSDFALRQGVGCSSSGVYTPVNEQRRTDNNTVLTQNHIYETASWSTILEKLPLSGMSLALASHCVLSHLSEDRIELSLAAKHEPLLNKKLIERIEQALNQYLGKTIQLSIKTATVPLNTPAGLQEQKQAERHTDATHTIQNNAHVQKIIDLFDATLDLNSITAT